MEKTKIIFFKFRIVAGSIPYKPINLGIKISHGCREIALCPLGYFNLSHPVYQSSFCKHICIESATKHTTSQPKQQHRRRHGNEMNTVQLAYIAANLSVIYHRTLVTHSQLRIFKLRPPAFQCIRRFNKRSK